VRVLDAFGCDVVIVETVGVGQDELEITRTAHSTLVVMAPGMGDEVQAIKAGLLEVADIVVVNKGDRPGAQRTASQLRAMLMPSGSRDDREAGDASRPAPKRPEVLITTAATGDGVPELLAALDRHRVHGVDGATRAARRNRACAQVRAVLIERLWDRLAAPGMAGATDAAIDAVAGHELDPYAAADRLLAALGAADDVQR
jgi:LAO/AO transport system kinase